MQNLNQIEYEELKSGIEFNIKDIINHCLANGWDNKIEGYFNDINDVICKKKTLENINDEDFLGHIEYSVKTLNNIVSSNQDTFTRYKINININSEEKKSIIERDSKEIFYSILKTQYKILKEKFNLHLKTPEDSQTSLSDSLETSIKEFSNSKIILE